MVSSKNLIHWLLKVKAEFHGSFFVLSPLSRHKTCYPLSLDFLYFYSAPLVIRLLYHKVLWSVLIMTFTIGKIFATLKSIETAEVLYMGPEETPSVKYTLLVFKKF